MSPSSLSQERGAILKEDLGGKQGRPSNCGLRIDDCGIENTSPSKRGDCGLTIAECGFRIADFELRISNCGLRIADWGLTIAELKIEEPGSLTLRLQHLSEENTPYRLGERKETGTRVKGGSGKGFGLALRKNTSRWNEWGSKRMICCVAPL